ncbi:MAG: AAA domain-containing protein [Microthrixaceae bacterium]
MNARRRVRPPPPAVADPAAAAAVEVRCAAMEEQSDQRRASAVLQVLADLSPTSTAGATGLRVPTEWFHWLPVSSAELFQVSPWATSPEQVLNPTLVPASGAAVALPSAPVPKRLAERLMAIDQVRPFESSIRVGWLFVSGTTRTDDGKRRRVFHPLVHRSVRVSTSLLGGGSLSPTGDVSLTHLVDDPELRQELEGRVQWGGGALGHVSSSAVSEPLLARLTRLAGFARSAADAAKLPATKLIPATGEPDRLMRSDGLRIVAGVGVFAVKETGDTSRSAALRAWAALVPPGGTAFHSFYLGTSLPEVDGDAPEGSEGEGEDLAGDRSAEPTVRSASALTVAQRAAVVESRRADVSVISGAPGTGKSHTLVATALDALARGETVLVAAKDDAAVDALLTLLEGAPGPDPVVFGSTGRREALAARLAAGQAPPASNDQLRQAVEAFQRAWSEWAVAMDEVRARLRAAVPDATLCEEVARCRTDAPGFFRADVDLARSVQLIAELEQGGTRWRDRAARRRLERQVRAEAESPSAPVEVISHALGVARRQRSRLDLELAGGLEVGSSWESLRRLERAAHDATSRWLAIDSRSKQRMNGTLPAVAALATALRSGRAARRQMLGSIDGRLTRALPLWIGSLTDIDDLLPMVPALFDLVIIDEASSLNQTLAAPALLRGRRAVISGDPKQLRHVSFVSGERMAKVLDQWGLADDHLLGARLNLQRNSTFDAAAGAAPVHVLDEHFRSAPHLMEFVAKELYGGAVKVATRTPLTQSKDCIKVVRLDGARDTGGIVASEVDWCIARVRRLLQDGRTSVGLVSPFRAQADALEAAVLDTFTVHDLQRLDLRVGTVHAFQGNEREVVIASLGTGADATANAWRFIEDPHLFAVLATRARRHLTVLVSGDPPAGGLVARYLAQADAPPGPPRRAHDVSPWVDAVADYLRSGGVGVMPAYPTGHHVVDLAIDGAPIAVECSVHPAGPTAHIERHLELRGLGWTILEAYESRWGHRRGELAVELLAKIRQSGLGLSTP